MTIAEFVLRAREVHNNKYDYSKVVITKFDNPVTIICPIHGEFQQLISNHLAGKGCKLCGRVATGEAKNLGTEGFIKKAKITHGNKYDYSKSNYINARTRLLITCKEHGDFLQTPDAHIRGQGCPKCKAYKLGLASRLTTEEFVNKANLVHNNYYNYDKTEYKTAKDKCVITCPIHGDFLQDPSNHLAGKGCPQCGLLKIQNNFKYSETELLQKVKEDHPNNDFTIISYKGSQTLFECTCKEHGNFQKTYLQLLGVTQICPKCCHFNRSYEELVELFNKVHNNSYAYPNFEYKNTNQKIKIICPKHGEFIQTISHHLSGTGCPVCKSSHGEKFIFKCLKELKINFVPQYNVKTNERNFRIDFYLKDYNMYIEYNGVQHYEVCDYFGGEEKLKEQQKRDELLRTYCKENDIILLEIKYDLTKDEIFNKIKDILNMKKVCNVSE